ncbi:MAG: alpha-D-ribose 1-methylphosphonate 5-triphosphate diphosphatase [Marinibacterium sp.]|nr:alpha-D-ribose 1-methylphosphonate 5-triphosphate diphosphatase [Marinibacterium sp.]
MSAPLHVQGAGILRDGRIETGDIGLADGMFADDAPGRRIDLSGYLVLPGIVDLHGDGFERHVAPRRGAMKSLSEGLRAAASELAVNGVTTGVLAQFQSWEGGLRGADFADQVLTAIAALNDTLDMDLIGQLRFEVNLIDDYDALPARIDAWGLRYVVFNDHLPHDRLAAGRKPPRLTGQALKAGRSPERHLALMQDLHARRADVPPALDRLCADLAARGVRMGSHDDRSADTRAIWRGRGARIAEFPETLDAAEAARAGGDIVVMGAPNVVRGGSHNGNVSALDLVTLGLCDALASDYHYPSLIRAVRFITDAGLRDLAGAWALVSQGPAQALDLPDRGRIAPGLRADFVVMNAETRRVEATFAQGTVTHMTGAVAARFLA